MADEEHPNKRVKLARSPSRATTHSPLTSLERPISPPRTSSRSRSQPYKQKAVSLDDSSEDDIDLDLPVKKPPTYSNDSQQKHPPSGSHASIKSTSTRKIVNSPFSLTRIRDLPEALNKQTLALPDLIGSPLIRELWCFNYLTDVNFLLSNLDIDVRDQISVHVVHGFWKKDNTTRQTMELQASEHSNVTLHTTYLPEPFGTHHTKMLILFNHDDTAEIIIHTANMIVRDWANMTQAVWRSPRLELSKASDNDTETRAPEGSGTKFRLDLLAYLTAYNRHRPVCKSMIAQLKNFDFTPIRASLVGSVPGRHSLSEAQWGWPAMRRVLNMVAAKGDNEPEIVIQISSIATLGPNDTWLSQTLFPALSGSKVMSLTKPRFKIVFPTAEEIRRSLDGYGSGGSIHTKIQSAQQAKQLQYLKPLFHHWAADVSSDYTPDISSNHDAGRKRAAPHIKTYVRFSDRSMSKIDWVLITSANLSKQAWGEAPRGQEVRICSYELGVLEWPALWDKDAEMVPTFKTNSPLDSNDEKALVGFRMPYDIPLLAYSNDDVPWVNTMEHQAPDWLGNQWLL